MKNELIRTSFDAPFCPTNRWIESCQHYIWQPNIRVQFAARLQNSAAQYKELSSPLQLSQYKSRALSGLHQVEERKVYHIHILIAQYIDSASWSLLFFFSFLFFEH